MIQLSVVVHCQANRATDALQFVNDYSYLQLSDLTSNQVLLCSPPIDYFNVSSRVGREFDRNREAIRDARSAPAG